MKNSMGEFIGPQQQEELRPNNQQQYQQGQLETLKKQAGTQTFGEEPETKDRNDLQPLQITGAVEDTYFGIHDLGDDGFDPGSSQSTFEPTSNPWGCVVGE